MSKKQTVLDIVSDLAGSFVYYDRKECESLSSPELELAIVCGDVTKAEILEEFERSLVANGFDRPFRVGAHLSKAVADDSAAEVELAAAAQLIPRLGSVHLQPLYDWCVELMVPVDAPSGRNLKAWGDFTGVLLDELAARGQKP